MTRHSGEHLLLQGKIIIAGPFPERRRHARCGARLLALLVHSDDPERQRSSLLSPPATRPLSRWQHRDPSAGPPPAGGFPPGRFPTSRAQGRRLRLSLNRAGVRGAGGGRAG